jgi:hypothetical protein
MVDPFILRAGWGSHRCPLSLMSSWSCTFVSARLFPLQLITKWSNTFIICRCCTRCSTDRQNSTSHHRSQLCWLLPTLLLFGWHHLRAFTSGDYRERHLKYLSPSITNAMSCQGISIFGPNVIGFQLTDRSTDLSVAVKENPRAI